MPCALRTRYKPSPAKHPELQHVDKSSANSAHLADSAHLAKSVHSANATYAANSAHSANSTNAANSAHAANSAKSANSANSSSDIVLGHGTTHSANRNSAMVHTRLDLNISPHPEVDALTKKPSQLKPLFRKLKLKTSSREIVTPRDVAELTSTCKQRKNSESCYEQLELTVKSEEGSNLVDRDTPQPQSLFGNAKVHDEAVGSDDKTQCDTLGKISDTKSAITKLALQDESQFTVTASEKCGKRSRIVRKPSIKVEVEACGSDAISAEGYNRKSSIDGEEKEAERLAEPRSQRREKSRTDLDQPSTSKPQQKRLRREIKVEVNRQSIAKDTGGEFERMEVKAVKTEKADQPQATSNLLAACPLCQVQFDQK